MLTKKAPYLIAQTKGVRKTYGFIITQEVKNEN